MEEALDVRPAREAAAEPEIRKLTGKIGAIVSNVDLTRPLADETFETLHTALVEHQVLFFRDQDLTEDQHRAVAARFGTLSIYPAQRLAGDTSELSYIADNAASPPKADDWHTDISWLPEPPRYAFLNARKIPEHGGDTMWASLYAAYDALSPAMQELCGELTALHAPSPKQLAAFRNSGKFGPDIAEKIAEIFQPVEHPLVRTHPISGRRGLYLSTGFLQRIIGVTDSESEMLKTHLNALLDDPNVQVRWKWRPFDFAIWDEASTNHRALSDHYPQERLVRRCTVDGDRPFYRP
jgi:taurine dioxygenase